MNEAIRLSIKFFTEIKGMQKDKSGKVIAPSHYKKMIMESINAYLAGGLKGKELEEIMDEYKELHPNPNETYKIEEVLDYLEIKAVKSKPKEDPENLLEKGRFYYHPQLQVTPDPPVIEILPDGTFKSSYEEEEFFLEMKERYTLDDLVDYFYQKIENKSRVRRKRDKGAFQYLLKNYDIELVLFAIDESIPLSQDLGKKRPQSPFDIEEYIEHGEVIFEARKNTLHMEGINHVIPRS